AYRVPKATRGAGTYGFVVLPQPSFEPPTVRVRIDAPPGETIAEASTLLDVGGSTARYAGRPTEPITFWIRLA
ncbi:MAG: hypothetical protein ACRDGK_07865, partial [Actinomycetota bacterium]